MTTEHLMTFIGHWLLIFSCYHPYRWHSQPLSDELDFL